MSKNWKALLGECTNAMLVVIRGMTDNELRSVVRARDKRTSSNCGWIEHGASPLLAEVAANELLGRKLQRRREKKAAKIGEAV